MANTHNPRTPETEVDAIFIDRWSPRSFLDDPIPEPELLALFEAARWAPSCANEQPWLFIFARTGEDRARFASALNDRNRLWADRAPVLLFICARKFFAGSGKPNRHAMFDAGAAWMSFALQARRLGLYSHGMAGFDPEKACDVLGLPCDRYEVIAAVALGRRGPAGQLPPDMADREIPGDRKPLSQVFQEGRFTEGNTAQ